MCPKSIQPTHVPISINFVYDANLEHFDSLIKFLHQPINCKSHNSYNDNAPKINYPKTLSKRARQVARPNEPPYWTDSQVAVKILGLIWRKLLALTPVIFLHTDLAILLCKQGLSSYQTPKGKPFLNWTGIFLLSDFRERVTLRSCDPAFLVNDNKSGM